MSFKVYKDDCAVLCDIPGCENEMPGSSEDEAREHAGLVGWFLKKPSAHGPIDVCDECGRGTSQAAQKLSTALQQVVAAAIAGPPPDPAGAPVDILAQLDPEDDDEDADEDDDEDNDLKAVFGNIGRANPPPAPMPARRNKKTFPDERGATLPGVTETPEQLRARKREERKYAGPINRTKFQEVEDLLHDTAWSPSARRGGSS